MTNTEFNRLADLSPHNHGAATLEALRLVLVKGLTPYQAAKDMRINQTGLGRALRMFPLGVCESCKQAILP